MSDVIYLIDQKSKSPTRIDRTSFASIGVKERKDLEAWVLAHPELLGERMLIVTPEFDQFDKSSKRLDVLALDETGNLVVIELKLDVAASHADLQAIRYAAFCSTMTMKEVISAYTFHHQVSEEAAEATILSFLEQDELPEIGNKPRIILAAGSMDDEEVTSCVLWLRGFGVDISCVEITPYRMPDQSIILVPKIIIPLPETREYMVRVEDKEVAKVAISKSAEEYGKLWSAVKNRFNSLDCPVKIGMNSKESWLVVRGGGDIHYAWWQMKKEKTIRLGIGFRYHDAAKNDIEMDVFRPRQAELSRELGYPVKFQTDWGPLTRRMYVSVPYDGSQPLDEVADLVARLMAKIVALTLPTLIERGTHSA